MESFQQNLICPNCSQARSREDFYWRKDGKNNKAECRACSRERNRRWRAANPARKREYQNAYYRLNHATAKRRADGYRLRDCYGLSLEEYSRMAEAQQHRCKICKLHQTDQKRKMAVDHCHATGKIRGLLCSNCNQAIGKLRDSVELLNAAIEYLKAS